MNCIEKQYSAETVAAYIGTDYTNSQQQDAASLREEVSWIESQHVMQRFFTQKL